ncbi:hypothetical protein PIB30_097469 [Stylosanthes scabra]|uniref:Uncharacterized protein n=1 Tax=Stylosanthes scabra TaxID=79078 RepID=A0ABU6QYT5_9FABA|nr:hypothetical protein [Stylosanthes scabra]
MGVLAALVLGRSRLGGHRHLGQPRTWSGITGTPNDGTMLARKPRGGQFMGPKHWQRAQRTLENLEQHPLPIIGCRTKTKVPRDDILFRGETYGKERETHEPIVRYENLTPPMQRTSHFGSPGHHAPALFSLEEESLRSFLQQCLEKWDHPTHQIW